MFALHTWSTHFLDSTFEQQDGCVGAVVLQLIAVTVNLFTISFQYCKVSSDSLVSKKYIRQKRRKNNLPVEVVRDLMKNSVVYNRYEVI